MENTQQPIKQNEQTQQQNTTPQWRSEPQEVSLSKMADSMYKTQLAMNGIKFALEGILEAVMLTLDKKEEEPKKE